MADSENLIPDFEPLRPAVLVTWQDYGLLIDDLACRMIGSYEPEIIIGIFRGGWVVAQSLMDYFPDACIMGARVVGTDDESIHAEFLLTDDGNEIIDKFLKGKRVLLVDEVIDSGNTIRFFHEQLLAFAPADVKLTCLHYFSDAVVEADFCAVQFKESINYVLPWRLYRDLWCLVGNILKKGRSNSGKIKTELQTHFGVELSEAAITNALEYLAKRGFAIRGDKFWNFAARGGSLDG